MRHKGQISYPVVAAGVRRRSSGVPEDLPIFIREESKPITVEEKMTAAKRERLGKVVELLAKPSRWLFFILK